MQGLPLPMNEIGALVFELIDNKLYILLTIVLAKHYLRVVTDFANFPVSSVRLFVFIFNHFSKFYLPKHYYASISVQNISHSIQTQNIKPYGILHQHNVIYYA